MTALLYGVGAALGWGIADYAAGLAARRLGSYRVSLGMQLAGGSALALALGASGRWPSIDVDVLGAAALLALLGVVTLMALYRALALGPIAVVSPVTGANIAVTVVLAVAFLGDRLTPPQLGAIGLVFVGVVLASTDLRLVASTLGRPTPGVRWALFCMLGFGVWQALFAGLVRERDGLAVILAVRALSALLLVAGLARFRLPALRRSAAGPPRWGATALALVVTVGLFDTLANVAFFFGVREGYASVVATGAGAYPVVPAILAITFLHERLAPNQYVGVAVLVAGLVGLGLVT